MATNTGFPSLSTILYNSLFSNQGIPAWKTLRGLSTAEPEPCAFTLILNANYHDYPDHKTQNPTYLTTFDNCASYIQKLRSIFSHSINPRDITSTTLDKTMQAKFKLYVEWMSKQKAISIYSSNFIERAGLSKPETLKQCHEVFLGINPTAPGDGQGKTEVIQHAKAMLYIIDIALNCSSSPFFSEDLIKETHQILCEGVSLPRNSSSSPTSNSKLKEGQNGKVEEVEEKEEEYAGIYRTTTVCAGTTIFTSPAKVPHEMAILISDFNTDIREREITRILDPFFLAADVCQDLVTIHPFRDGNGNGRLCRLVANAFLVRFAGVVVAFGGYEDEGEVEGELVEMEMETEERDRERYLGIAELAGDGEMEEVARGCLAGLVLVRGEGALRGLVGGFGLNLGGFYFVYEQGKLIFLSTA